MKIVSIILLFVFVNIINSTATDYHVGPNQDYANIYDVPWEPLAAGDHVLFIDDLLLMAGVQREVGGQHCRYRSKFIYN